MLVREYLVGPLCWLAAYSFIDGLHALIALVDVGVLRIVWPHAASEPWMYPPLFRSGLYMLTCRLRDIWGKMWHDLCRRPLLAVSSLILTPTKHSSVLHKLAVLVLSFVVSGSVHAAGAYAVSQDVIAASMMMVFFLVMALCIALQQLVEVAVASVISARYVRGVVTWCADAVVLLAWAYYTCPWFIAWSMMPEAIVSISMPFSLWSSDPAIS
ncbi:hypothetical protein FE257_007232 [Aspergillus nanangensis]|uniref:Wax synthase domain-containing protein n=1 Tax=Aspergillus nanangensis TaxID=2582783 RepID=A0AAD4CNF5_ASPNN|nr:hypothetical protein FE257_007232 [Aspergillus nanangensis]